MKGLRTGWQRMSLICFLLTFFAMVPGQAVAIQLNLGEAYGPPGSDVTIPITLNYLGATPNIAGTSNDIGFNTALLESPTATLGPAGTAAAKMVVQNLPSAGVFRVGVIGLNQNIIQGGIVAYVTFHIKSGAATGDTNLTNTPSASDPNGVAVTLSGSTGGEVDIQQTIYVGQDGLCGSKSPCYTTIQNGVNAAETFALICITDESYGENVILDSAKILSFDGGWNSAFTTSASSTTINGSLTINNGGLNVKSVRVE